MDKVQSLIFYISTLGLSVLLFYLARKYKARRWLFVSLVILALAIPVIISGIRYNVGADYISYSNKMPVAMTMDMWTFSKWFHNMEPSFWVLSRLSLGLFGNEVFFFAFSGFLTVLFFYLAVKRVPRSNMPLAMLLLLFVIFPQSLSGVRQGVAIAIVTYALTWLLEKKFWQYAALIILAGLFHYSSLAMLAAYPLFCWFNNPKGKVFNKITTIIVAFPILFFGFMATAEYLPLFKKYSIYSGEFIKTYGYMLKSHNILPELFAIVVSLLFYKYCHGRKMRRLILLSSLLMLLITLLGYVLPLVGRFADYFMPIFLIFFSMLPGFFSDKLGKILATVAIVGFAIGFFVLAFYIKGSGTIFPYRFIF